MFSTHSNSWSFYLNVSNPGAKTPLQPPAYDTPCANPIQFLAKYPDFLSTVVEFAELRRH
jgi:hypothetical protein